MRNTYCIICLQEKYLHQTRAGIGPITNMPCPTAASDPKAFDMAIWIHAGNTNAISIPFWIWLGVWLLLFGQIDTFTLASTIWLLWLVSWGLIACQLWWLSSSQIVHNCVCKTKMKEFSADRRRMGCNFWDWKQETKCQQRTGNLLGMDKNRRDNLNIRHAYPVSFSAWTESRRRVQIQLPKWHQGHQPCQKQKVHWVMM